MTRDEMLSAIDALRAGVVALGQGSGLASASPPAAPEPVPEPDPVRVAARSLLVEVLRHRATITALSAAMGALASWLLRGTP